MGWGVKSGQRSTSSRSRGAVDTARSLDELVGGLGWVGLAETHRVWVGLGRGAPSDRGCVIVVECGQINRDGHSKIISAGWLCEVEM